MFSRTLLVLMAAFGPTMAGAADSVPGWREPVTGMEFVLVPKGCFQMGSIRALPHPGDSPAHPTALPDRPFNDELPQHEVCVDAFWMGKLEVSRAEWHRVMGGDAETPAAPAAEVSWEQATRFAARLSQRSGGKERFRLPTEAEWEYACRAGTTEETVASFDELSHTAWYGVQRDLLSAPQWGGLLAPNAFGLHDMLGNVWEWVQDSYVSDGYSRHELFNPVVEVPDPVRVIRGASFRTEPGLVRCAKRASYPAREGLNTIGFRLVRVQQGAR